LLAEEVEVAGPLRHQAQALLAQVLAQASARLPLVLLLHQLLPLLRLRCRQRDST
jgi:hypothetical protein